MESLLNEILYFLSFLILGAINPQMTDCQCNKNAALVVSVHCHGRLLNPPSRASLWRFKTDPLIAPYARRIRPNYNDNQLFCGGAQTQRRNNGKCGVCGDSYTAATKDHEAGGKYALGIITRYYEIGQIIPVRVQITAGHKGYFEFRLCPWNNPTTPITHECLNRYLLRLPNGDTKWNLPNPGVGYHNIMVKLPDNISCTQCVLQWRYRTGEQTNRTGNSWGTDENGQSGLGYGHQEEFYGCSDVAIGVNHSNPVIPDENIPSSSPQIAISSTPFTTTKRNYVSSRRPRPSKHPRPSKPRPNRLPRPDHRCRKQDYRTGRYKCWDCDTFYRCVQGFSNPIKISCPLGTACNRRNGRCVHRYDVQGC